MTRASIILRKSLSKRMDCRVKPGNDGIGKRPGAIPAFFLVVIASEAKQSRAAITDWIASSLRSSQ
jgi:hypothetical protein